MVTYAVLSRLLQYPSRGLADEVAEMRMILAEEGLLTAAGRQAIEPLLAQLRDGEEIELQERYTDLFDRTRSLSLHLFEHVHGESRDRGQAMVELLERYREAGLEIAARELPDYLPLYLEYLSLLPPKDAAEGLAAPVALLSVIRDRLEKRDSPYAAVFCALEELAGTVPVQDEVEKVLEEPDDDPNDFLAVDRVYAEEPVSFMETPRQAAIGSILARKRERRS